MYFFFFSSRRRHTRCSRDWSSDVCSSDLLSSTADIGVHLSLRGFDEALRFGAGGFDEAPLLLPGFLERLLANGGRLGVGLTQPRRVLFDLMRRLGTRGLGLLQRSLDRAGALLHLREERPVEQTAENQKEDDEVHRLDDERLVEADQAAAAVLTRRRVCALRAGGVSRAHHEGREGENTQEAAKPNAAAKVHEEGSPLRRKDRPRR